MDIRHAFRLAIPHTDEGQSAFVEVLIRPLSYDWYLHSPCAAPGLPRRQPSIFNLQADARALKKVTQR